MTRVSMNIAKAVCCMLLVSAVVLCGCSSMEGKTDLSKAGVGAAAGAVVGAGVGAIIGSASGNAGAGIAIGSVAGAVAGGAIGSSMQNRDEQRSAQKNPVWEQNKQYASASGNGIGHSAFEIPRANVSSAQPRIVPEKYKGNPEAQRWGKEEVPARQNIKTAPPVEARARFGEMPKTRPLAKPLETAKISKTNSNAVAPKLPVAEKNLVPENKPNAAEKITTTEETIALADPGEPSGGLEPEITRLTSSGLPPAAQPKEEPVIEPKTVAKVETKANAVSAADSLVVDDPAKRNPKEPRKEPALTEGSNCTEADAEAVRARSAASDADKLFYFRRALRLCPKEPAYHVEIGRVYGAIGRTEDARFEFNKALEMDPENQNAQEELSVLMLDDGKTSKKNAK